MPAEFSCLDLSYETYWTINGDPSKADDGSKCRPGSSGVLYAYQQPTSSLPGTSGGMSKKWKPSTSLSLIRNKPPGVATQEGKKSAPSWTKTLEISSYDPLEAVFKKTFNLPLEEISTVNDLASAEAFGGDAVIILDSDNLRIPDSAGTRGECIINLCKS